MMISFEKKERKALPLPLSGYSWCLTPCWFAFVLRCGYCSVSFQSFVLRHLVIAPVCNTKKLFFILRSSVMNKQQRRVNKERKKEKERNEATKTTVPLRHNHDAIK